MVEKEPFVSNASTGFMIFKDKKRKGSAGFIIVCFFLLLLTGEKKREGSATRVNLPGNDRFFFLLLISFL